MHLPDGFLSARVALGYGLVASVAVVVACHRLRSRAEPPNRALLGVTAAFVFAAQMVNFPVVAGTSGHLVGSALSASLLGLPSALVVMTSVLFVQCFVFGDGGVLALGANVFNMGLVSCLIAACCYRLLCGPRPSPTRRVAAVAFAAWCATVFGAASCAEQLALSGTARWSLVLPAMLGVHALIGAGEALITAMIVATVLRFRPELLEPALADERARPAPIAWGLGLALAVAMVLAPFAASDPDGLMRVALQLGFVGSKAAVLSSPLAEYGIPGLRSGVLSTVLAGCVGTVLLYGMCWLLALGLVPRSAKARHARVVAESSG
jgi:cobalt/nickel transport system permease protein